MSGLRRIPAGGLICRLLAVCTVAMLLAVGAMAQTTPDTLPTPEAFGAAQSSATAPDPAAPPGPDYAAWEKVASEAEAAIPEAATTGAELEAIRAQVVTFRQAFLGAQNTNANRIATLRDQLGALGVPPADGATEAPEISARRAELNDMLNQLQAPGIAAGEAYRRAEGIIRQIDSLLRDRQASELMELWPLPINPANWPAAYTAVKDNWVQLGREVVSATGNASRMEQLRSKAPALLALLLIGLALILRARALMERLANRLPRIASPRWVKVWSLLISVAQILLPVTGLLLILTAVQNSEMLGVRGTVAANAVASVGILALFAGWLGRRIFPKESGVTALLRLNPRQRAEGRFVTTMLGVLIGLDSLREAMVDVGRAGEVAVSVLSFPVLVVSGLFLVRLGYLLRRHSANDAAVDAPTSFQSRVIALLGRAAIVIGVVGPVLAAVGYVPAALALVFPAIASLSLLAMLHILQRLVDEIYDLLTGRAPEDGDALIPVLIGFAMSIATLPLLALIWGARNEDLGELWAGFRQGFSIGETRIAPADFMVFVVIFLLGYMITRLFQAALRSSVLPRTRMDLGARNALLAGIGYVGVFLSGLIAINAAGINLAGLAIVAGALSVGIGFGLQNIVQNFVSGIILLVERPVSEGDWIEVAGVQGTVQAISVRSTRIQTFDRTDVIVPNGDLVSGQVTNYTRFNLTGRLIVPVSVSNTSDTRAVERVLREIAEAEPMAVMNPAPAVVLMGFQADALNFEIRMILRDVNFSLSVRSEMNHEIIRRLRAEGIQLPFSQREVWIHAGGEGLRQRAQMDDPKPIRGPMLRDEVENDTDAAPDAEDNR